MHNCSQAIVITTSTFTSAAIEMADKLKIEYLDGDSFRTFVKGILKTEY